MNRFEKSLIITTLKNILDEILIINKGRCEITKTPQCNKEPVSVRFKSKIHESVQKKLDCFQDTVESLNDIKLQQDISFILMVLFETIHDIRTENSLDTLLNVIEKYEQERLDEENFLLEYKNNKNILQDLENTMKIQFKNAEDRLFSYEEEVARLRGELNNIRKLNALEKGLTLKWEKARIEQGSYLMKIQENELEKEIKFYRDKISDEKMAIIDIETFNNLKIQSYQDQLVYWQKRHSDELAELQEQIKMILKQIAEIENKIDIQNEIYMKRQEFIDDFLKRKEEERKEFEFQQKRINSAIKIQAWWRGNMVRHHLGPYKKKKKGKKGKKK